MLHSSCVVVDGAAYAFSADSGTGKSTHTALWLKHFGNRAYMLNDDKPAIRLVGDRVYACGTPWSGEYDYSHAGHGSPGGHLLSRAGRAENFIHPADTKKAVFNIFSQTVRKLGPNAMERLFDMLETIFAKVPLYELGCNISDDAVRISYNAMKPKGQSEESNTSEKRKAVTQKWVTVFCYLWRYSAVSCGRAFFGCGKYTRALNKSPSMSSSNFPCWALHSSWAMLRPRPLPSLVREASPRTNRWVNSWGEIFSGWAEIFLISNTPKFPCLYTRTYTREPAAEYCLAFCSRFSSTR